MFIYMQYHIVVNPFHLFSNKLYEDKRCGSKLYWLFNGNSTSNV